MLITLPSYQPLKLVAILKYNILIPQTCYQTTIRKILVKEHLITNEKKNVTWASGYYDNGNID